MRRLMGAAVVGGLLAACGLDVLGTRPLDGVDGGPLAEAATIDRSDLTDAAADTFVVPDAPEPPVFPSNVDASLIVADAGDLIGPATIDTSAGTIDFAVPPAGITFQMLAGGAAGIAVLSVGAFTVDKELTVTGDRALVVLASGPISIAQRIRIDGDGVLQGPGGYGPGLGPGAGGAGRGFNINSSGGGGAGHATNGAPGGNDIVQGGDAGTLYEMALVGGSGGGRADPVSCTFSVGGAGGGAIQIFSSSRIAIMPTGGVHAGGGGGRGGCSQGIGSGAGGGSGGYILIEAPSLEIHGILAANGGGGGGGGSNSDGTPGFEGTYGTNFADGGGSSSQSLGGSGASITTPPGMGESAGNAGGGGGAVGRIYLHFRGTKLDSDGGIFSPLPSDDGGL